MLFLLAFRLVELIVLNIGLEAHVINDRIFVVMVIMALITTFITSPVISFVYPPRFHKRIDVPAERLANDTGPLGQVRLLLLLESIDSLGQFAKLLRLFKGPNSGKADVPENETVTLKTLRIVRSSERSSSIIAASQATAAAEADPALKAANYLGEFLNVPASSTLATSTVSDVSDIINDFVAREDINLMLVPYTQLDGMTSAQMGEIISRSTVTTAILVGRLVVKVRRVEFILNTGILVPFVGGPDDRRAVTLALRLHQSAGIPLRIFHLRPIKMENTGKGAKSVTFDQKLEEDEKFMKDLRIKYERNDTVSFSSIDAGDPASVVAEECEQNDYELVLLGRSAKAPNGSTPDVVAMERKSSASMLAKISYIREFSRDSGKSALGGDSILGHMARKLMDSQANCSLLIVYEPPELKSV